MARIRLVVGLGNPGLQYSKTRHNAGFWFVEELAQLCRSSLRQEGKFHGLFGKAEYVGTPLLLLQPMEFMNRSGTSVASTCRFWKLTPEEVLVVHDELDFEPGIAKLKQGGGHGGHNGLRHIIEQLGSNAFFRLRIGIGHPGDRNRVADYVLSAPPPSEDQAIKDSIARALASDVLPLVLDGNLGQATQKLQAA